MKTTYLFEVCFTTPYSGKREYLHSVWLNEKRPLLARADALRKFGTQIDIIYIKFVRKVNF